MNTQLGQAFQQEMKIAKDQYRRQSYTTAFHHLERAHILGQGYVIPHTLSHCWMMKVGWQQRDGKEVAGQIPRILASLIISRFWVPLGNTGGTNVSPFKSMPLPKDLEKLLTT